MSKKISMSENSFSKLFGNINETSFSKVDNAYKKLSSVFEEMTYAFNDFYDTLKYNEDVNNPYVIKIKEHADAIKSILDKKYDQGFKFGNELNGFDYRKFYADKKRPEAEEDYDSLDLKYLQNKYPKEKGEF